MVIATAATTALVSSAQDDESLINKGFKLAVLIGLALAIGVGVFLIYTLSSIFEPLINLVSNAPGFLGVLWNLTPLGGITTGATYLLTSAFGRRS